MSPDEVRAAYRDALGEFETIVIRRYSGTGASRTSTSTNVRARVTSFAADELIGGIVQGDRKLIVLAEDVVGSIGTGASWKAVVRGKELQIKAVDDNTRRIQGELIAYEIAAGG